MDFARRASGILLSPLKMMETVASRTADYLLADTAAEPMPVVSLSMETTDEERQQQPCTKKAVKKSSPPARAIRKSASSKKSPTIKQEPLRDLPFRSGRCKAGFYSEKNLVELAWKGSGSSKDPIQLEP